VLLVDAAAGSSTSSAPTEAAAAATLVWYRGPRWRHPGRARQRNKNALHHCRAAWKIRPCGRTRCRGENRGVSDVKSCRKRAQAEKSRQADTPKGGGGGQRVGAGVSGHEAAAPTWGIVYRHSSKVQSHARASIGGSGRGHKQKAAMAPHRKNWQCAATCRVSVLLLLVACMCR
jgi:hypothetical protein